MITVMTLRDHLGRLTGNEASLLGPWQAQPSPALSPVREVPHGHLVRSCRCRFRRCRPRPRRRLLPGARWPRQRPGCSAGWLEWCGESGAVTYDTTAAGLPAPGRARLAVRPHRVRHWLAARAHTSPEGQKVQPSVDSARRGRLAQRPHRYSPPIRLPGSPRRSRPAPVTRLTHSRHLPLAIRAHAPARASPSRPHGPRCRSRRESTLASPSGRTRHGPAQGRGARAGRHHRSARWPAG
jgi:hypothetical protein